MTTGGEHDQTGRNGDVALDENASRAPEAVEAAVSETASTMTAVTEAVADAAEEVNQNVSDVATATSMETAQAFDAARERLNTLAFSPPAGAQDSVGRASDGEALGSGFSANYASAMQGMAEFNRQALAAWRVNAESALRHWQSLAAAKTMSEAIALNAQHTRQQLEAVSSQTRALSALATRIVRDAAKPMALTKP